MTTDCDLTCQTIRSCEDFSRPYIFVSYSHRDTEEVSGLLAMMQKNHFRFWYDDGIATGSEWEDVLYERIMGCSQFLCFFTKSSVKSGHVKNEIHIARKYGKPILPVFLDDVVLRGGLELALDRQQSLTRGDHDYSDFHRRLCAALDRHAMDHITTSEESAAEELKKHYRIIKQLGNGFSGTVYRAQCLRSGCNVIIKHGTLDDSYSGDSIRDSYENERIVLSKQISCYTPIVIDCIADSGNVFLVETMIQGTSLDKIEKLSDREIVRIFLKTAKILKRYHDKGIIHCDIKPDHILVDDEDVFLIDFGACYQKNQRTKHHMIGSVGYAAPEQFGRVSEETRDKEVRLDSYTDIYALGRSLLITLARAHGTLLPVKLGQETVDLEVVLKRETTFHAEQKTYTINQERYRKEVNPLLRVVVDKMIAPRVSARFERMDEVIDCLSALHGNI